MRTVSADAASPRPKCASKLLCPNPVPPEISRNCHTSADRIVALTRTLAPVAEMQPRLGAGFLGVQLFQGGFKLGRLANNKRIAARQ